MATNRKKHIDNASDDEELARFIANERCEEFYKCEKQCVPPKEIVVNWLSQEAEEDKKMCSNCKFHKKAKPCIGSIDKNCVNPKSKSCGTYTMSDCSCDEWKAEEKWGIDENHTQIANLPNETKIIELTEKAYKDILARLDKLEENIK